MLDRDKLLKLLKMTDSKWDGEALNAIRLANIAIKQENKTWDEFFSRGVRTRSFDEADLLNRIDALNEILSEKRIENADLRNENENLRKQCEWAREQMFGSERKSRGKTEYYEAEPKGYYDRYGRYVPKSKRR